VVRVRKTVPALAAMALAALFSLVILGVMVRDTGAPTAMPNIVFILADDMRKDDLRNMPKTRSLLGGKGMRFQNAFVSNPFAAQQGRPS